jgi:ketosteroid isomerase-like protein
MSQENMEVVGRMYDAFEGGDYETSLSYLDPEIEFSQPAQEPGATVAMTLAYVRWERMR